MVFNAIPSPFVAAELARAIPLRHSVRRFAAGIDADHAAALRRLVSAANSAGGRNMRLVTDEPTAFSWLGSYGFFRGVTGYVVVAGPNGDADLDIRAGFWGEAVVLAAVAMGLATCWVGATYRHSAVKGGADTVDERVVACIALGMPSAAQSERTVVANDAADWFQRGVEAASIAPSAYARRGWSFERHGNEAVCIPARRRRLFGGFEQVDAGIAALHFLLASNHPVRVSLHI